MDGYARRMLRSLGLGGDGDEVDAVERVERTFGVAFHHEELERFVTVGDVWRALLNELQLDEAAAAPLWPEFVAVLGEETLAADELNEVGRETVLIGGVPILAAIAGALRRLLRMR